MSHTQLTALSPLDGRYAGQVAELRRFFSEAALITYRIKVEIAYLFFLEKQGIVPAFSKKQRSDLLDIGENFNESQAEKVKKIEAKIHHDLKAVEYYLRDEFKKSGIPHSEFIHFALTSEDVNNLAYSLMLKEALQAVVFPKMAELLLQLVEVCAENRDKIMLGRTHGQAAVPTTLGKELLVFLARLHTEFQRVVALPIEGKLSGAVGNWNAHVAAFPQKDWQKLSQEFVKSLGLEPTTITTQILPPDSYSRIFQSLSLFNSILLGFTQDMWRYISDGVVVQAIASGMVGSSTMPQKINPIDFENSEGNLGTANALLDFFVQKLSISRLQRDLSDSTVKRNIGSALGFCLLGYSACIRGLQKISANDVVLQKDLLNHWEVVAEGVQTILRREGDDQAYEKLKTLTQGKQMNVRILHHAIEEFNVSESVKTEIRHLSPLTYVGLATKITKKRIAKN